MWQKSVDSENDIYHPLPQLTTYSMLVQMVGGTACGKHSTGGNWSKEESYLHIVRNGSCFLCCKKLCSNIIRDFNIS